MVVGMHGTVPKRVGKKTGGIGNQIKNQDHTEDFWKLGKTCCHFDSSERPPVKTDVKYLQGLK